jgi:ABC-type branched-subunit amino acid transport system substrate-binding protein
VLASALIVAAASAHAQILIGQTAGFTGPVADAVKEETDGAKLYIDAVNARGGINGQRIELLSVDDKFDPKLSALNARALAEKGVVALFLSRGTPNTQAILPVLAEFKLPLVAPSTGAMIFHQPVNPHVFNVRSSYQREAERVIQHLALVGVKRIAIVRADDSFAGDAYVGAARGFADVSLKPVLDEKFDRFKPDFSAIAPKLKPSNPQAILFICSGSTLADGAKAFRGAGSTAQIVTLSNNASSGTIRQMGANARGTIVSQVFPDERAMATLLVSEAYQLALSKKAGTLSPAMIEGFAGAKVLVEGLRRAGPKPTRDRLEAALNSMHKFDIGGMELNYSAGNHTGLDFVDLSIVRDNGDFMR